MTPAEITTFLNVFQTFVKLFDQVGVWGLLGAMLIMPFIMLCLVLWLNHSHNKRLEITFTAYRKDKEFLLEEHRKDTSRLLEEYRKDTNDILRHYGTRHDDVVKKHDFAISQLKTSEQHNATLHTLVVNNTQAMERLAFVIEQKIKN